MVGFQIILIVQIYFVSGRLGGFQGGGPNVIGIFCAIYSLICIYKLSSS